jgi:DNA-binding phage protein
METDKMPKSVSYHSYLIESLKDPKEASAYFKAVLEEGDVELLQKAINNLIEAGYNNLAIGLNLQDLNNPTLLSTIATKVESQNLFQTAEIELKQRVS